MTKMPSGRRKVALPRLPFSRLDNRGRSTAASKRCFCCASAAVDRPWHMDRGNPEGFLSPLCRCCTTAALHARQLWRISVASLPLVHQPRRFNRGALIQAPRLSIFALFAQSSPVRAKIPLLSEKPTKTSKETLKPRFYPRNIHKRIRKGGYTNRAIR